MAVTPLCTQADVESLLSEFGVVSRADDDQDGEADSGTVDHCIEKATVTVGQYLLARYAVAVLAASAWVKWATAVLAAVELSRRRNCPVSESLADEAKQLIEELKAIRDGREQLMADTGPAAPRCDDLPTVSNLLIDGRYRRAKIRRIGQTSTGSAPAAGRKQNNVGDNFGFGVYP